MDTTTTDRPVHAAHEPNRSPSPTKKTALPSKDSNCFVVNQPPNSKSVFWTAFSVLYSSTDRLGQLCKVPIPLPSALEAHEVERRIYERLMPLHLPNLVRVTDMDGHGIWMERALHGCLRLFDKDGNGSPCVSPARRLQWCEDVARVLAAIHGSGIRHADLSGRNLLVDKDMNILLCDFSGSAIDGIRATINAEAGYRHPDKKESEFPSIRCEIHSLGSTIYEIVTAHEVYDTIPKQEVDKLMDAGQYPSLINIPLANIIEKCWSGEFTSAEGVADAVALARRSGI